MTRLKDSQMFTGSPGELWAWLGENGHKHLWTRAVPRGHAIFVGRGKVGYGQLGLGARLDTWILEQPFFNSRRDTQGRWIAPNSKLIVRRVK